MKKTRILESGWVWVKFGSSLGVTAESGQAFCEESDDQISQRIRNEYDRRLEGTFYAYKCVSVSLNNKYAIYYS